MICLRIALQQTCLLKAVHKLIFIRRKGLLSRIFFPRLGERRHFVFFHARQQAMVDINFPLFFNLAY